MKNGKDDHEVIEIISDEEGIAPPSKRAKKLSPLMEEYEQFKGDGSTRKFCLIMIVDPDEDCRSFLQECENNCSPEVHAGCFQREGTLHFTLFNQALTYRQAMAYTVNHSSAVLPKMNLTGFHNWPSCVALVTDTSIQSVLDMISPRVKPPGKLHISLYRAREPRGHGRDPARAKIKKIQFDRVRHCTSNMNKGKAQGVRIVLKEMGADYFGQDEGKFFRVLLDTSVM